MTFILSHPLAAGPTGEQTTVLLSDFRVSRKSGSDKHRADAINKWERFDNRLVYAVAGPNVYWTRANRYVNEVMPEIAPNTFFEAENTFVEALRAAAVDASDDLRHGARFGCLGVLLDGDKHHSFVSDGRVGEGARLQRLARGEVEIVGNLGLVGERSKFAALQKRVVERVQRMVSARRSIPGHDASNLSHAAREAVLHELERAGPTSFTELDISPALVTAAALNGDFMLFGGEVRGFRARAGGVFHETGYDIVEDPDGNIELRDHASGEQNRLRAIADFEEALSEDTVDPELRADATDLAALFPKEDCVYRLIQDVHRPFALTNEEAEDPDLRWLTEALDRSSDLFSKTSVARTLEAVHLEPETGIQSPRTVCADIRTLENEEDARQHAQGEFCFALNEKDLGQEVFEREVEDHLFDDDWLSARVPGLSESLMIGHRGETPGEN